MIRISGLEICVAILFATVSAFSAEASIVTDQSQLTGTNELGTSNLGFDNVQSFQQTNNNITGASVGITGVPTNAFITIRLFDTFGDVSDPSRSIASGTAASPGSGFVSVEFDSGPIFITPGDTYFLTFEKSLSDTGFPVVNPNVPGAFLGSTANPYADGRLFSRQTDFNDSTFQNFDFAFQTFADSTAVAVPEPSTAMFLSIGLLGATFRRRRR